MSADDELKNGNSSSEEPRNDDSIPEADSLLPEDDSSEAYDVAGAALGALGPGEDADLYAAAAMEPRVSAELAAMEAIAAELARLAPQQLMNRGRSAGIRSRLVARAAATRVGRPVAKVPASDIEQSAARPSRPAAPPARRHPSPTTSVSGSAARPTPIHVIPFEPRARPEMGRLIGMVALAAVVLIAAFGIYSWRTRSVTGGAETAAASHDSSLEAQVATLSASLAQKDSLIASLTGMHTRVIDLVSYATADPMARVFWDQKTQMFVMYASNLKPPANGKTYQMWLITRGAAPVSAGTFTPDANGSAIVATKHPMAAGTLRRVAVTEEPDGGMPAPTGPVVFAGVGK